MFIKKKKINTVHVYSFSLKWKAYHFWRSLTLSCTHSSLTHKTHINYNAPDGG